MGPCIDFISGCTDENAYNFDPNANTNVGCIETIQGCTDINKYNFNPNANTDGLCIDFISGCTDVVNAYNYGDVTQDVNENFCYYAYTLSQIDNATNAAYAEGAASVTPEDGIGQADVDAVNAEGAAAEAAADADAAAAA